MSKFGYFKKWKKVIIKLLSLKLKILSICVLKFEVEKFLSICVQIQELIKNNYKETK